MTATISIILAIALCVACWFLFDNTCNLAVAERKLADSDRIRHDIAASAMRGAPAVWFARPQGMDNPAADAGYWRVMIAGTPHDFTTEQVEIAARRAAHFTDRNDSSKQ